MKLSAGQTSKPFLFIIQYCVTQWLILLANAVNSWWCLDWLPNLS